ncbi:MAG TPA: hypothetical protein VMX38_17755 [Verrucomicrobiae bacterium]|nr:hypothetical protein [Verrucomicrobiae bacterium]
MAAVTYEKPGPLLAQRGVDWGAIWAGVFTFVAIWSVFGTLGAAIFTSSANSNAVNPISGMSVGMSIWAIVLTIIAMYVAGMETGRLAQVATRRDGMLHGMAMFGLSVVAALVILVIGSASLTGGTGTAATAHSPYYLTVISELGWAGFVALFLGWLAALGGASSGARPRPQVDDKNVQPIRNAA